MRVPESERSGEGGRPHLAALPAPVAAPDDRALRRRVLEEYRRAQRAGRRRLDLVQQRDALYRRPLAVSDALAYVGAMWLGASVVGGLTLTPWILAGVPVMLLAAKLLGLYDRDENRLHRGTLDEVPGLFELATLISLLVVVTQSQIVTQQLSAFDIVAIWLALVALLVVGRTATRAFLNGIAEPERCVLVGDPATIGDVTSKVRLQGLHVEIVATLPADAISDAAQARDRDPGEVFLARVTPVVDRERAHRVIVASGSWPAEDLFHAVTELLCSGVKVSVLPSTARLASLDYEVDQLPGMALLGMKKFGISRSSQLMKRTFDLFVSAVALLLLSPVLIAIGLAIKLDSRGPALYRTRRIGRNGREFEMLKFRSMVAGADQQRDELRHLNAADGLFKIPDDPRITRVGRALRRRSLDELPQLVNVLRGQMSLVGPRPLLPVEDAQIEGGFRRRLNVTPGMTGHWQVTGSWRMPFDDMVVLDYLYTAHWSLWTDLKIIARTVPFIAGGRGA